MGVGSAQIEKKVSYKYMNKEIANIPNDLYTCLECNLIPEIIKIDYDTGIIEFKCPNHGDKKMEIKDYFKKEKKKILQDYNCQCDSDKVKKNYNLNYCTKCKKNFCDLCGTKHEHQSLFMKINDKNNKCHNHIKEYTRFCKKCNKHFCDTCKKQNEINCDNCSNILENIKEPDNNDIETLKNQKEILYNNIENEEYLIKLIDTLITTYQNHPSNYFISSNISKIAKNNKFIEKRILLEKIKNLERKVLDYLNIKFKVELKGNEIQMNLNGKHLGNIELNLLSGIDFSNLEELNLNNNDISDIKPIKDFSTVKLKKIDLSCNKIDDINPFNEILKKNKEMRYINLNSNKINNINLFKQNKFPQLMEIKLDNNNISKKDLDEIKRLTNIKECTLVYKLNNKKNKINLFGNLFVKKNQNKINLDINGKEESLKEYYNYEPSEISNDTITIKLFMYRDVVDLKNFFFECTSLKSLEGICEWDTSGIINLSNSFNGCTSLVSLPDISNWNTSFVTDMSFMFKGCSSLKSLPNIGKWDTKNVTNMEYMFYGCSKLKSIPYISRWNFSQVTNINYMFNECPSLLNKPDITKWNISEEAKKNYFEKLK